MKTLLGREIRRSVYAQATSVLSLARRTRKSYDIVVFLRRDEDGTVINYEVGTYTAAERDTVALQSYLWDDTLAHTVDAGTLHDDILRLCAGVAYIVG